MEGMNNRWFFQLKLFVQPNDFPDQVFWNLCHGLLTKSIGKFLMGFCNQIVVWNDGFQLGGRFINESTIGISVLFIGPFSTIQANLR